MLKRSKLSWRPGDVEAVYHQQSSRIFHDFNSPSPGKKGSWRAEKPTLYLHNEQAEVAGEAGRHMEATLGGKTQATTDGIERPSRSGTMCSLD